MDSKNKIPKLLSWVAATTAGALLVYAGTGLHPLWWATWLAPIPLLAFTSRATRLWPAMIACLLAWILGGFNLWSYLSETLHLPLVVRLVILLLPSLSFAAAVWVWRLQIMRGSAWRAALVLPCFWVGTEYLLALVSPHGSFGSIAYSQMDCLTVVQLAALGGAQAVSFVVFLTASTLAVLVSPQPRRRDKLWLGAGITVLLACIIAWGTVRLQPSPNAAESVTIGLVASDDEHFNYPQDSASALIWLGKYASAADALAKTGAEIVVLPEKIASLNAADAERAGLQFRSTAINRHAAIVVGWARSEGGRTWNEALMFLPDGRELRYEKRHLIPGLEWECTAGDDYATTMLGRLNLGIAICKDMDFSEISRAYGARKVALLLVPAWDFAVDRWLHSRMALMRGIEGGFFIARSAREGLLTMSDTRGRIIAEIPTSGPSFALLTLRITPVSEPTLYQRCGDWVGLACAIMTGLLLIRVQPPAPKSS